MKFGKHDLATKQTIETTPRKGKAKITWESISEETKMRAVEIYKKTGRQADIHKELGLTHHHTNRIIQEVGGIPLTRAGNWAVNRLEIVKTLCENWDESNRCLASRLGIARQTVRNYRARMVGRIRSSSAMEGDLQSLVDQVMGEDRRIAESVKESILEDIRAGNHCSSQLARKYGVSRYSVRTLIGQIIHEK